MKLTEEILAREIQVGLQSQWHDTKIEYLMGKYRRNPKATVAGEWPADDKFLRNRGIISLGSPGFINLYTNELIERYDIKRVVELGCNAGSSSVVWGHCLAKNGGIHTTVDNWQYSRYTRFCVDFLLHLFEIDNVSIVEGDLRVLDQDLENFPSPIPEFDLLFIDADHTYASVQKDMRYQALVKVGGYILFDDYGNTPVTDFVDNYMPEIDGFELVETKQFVEGGELEGAGIRGMENYGTALFRKTAPVDYAKTRTPLRNLLHDMWSSR